MSLQTRLSDLITAVGTDYKTFRTWLFGSATGTLTSLNTTDKTSIVGAINEINSKPSGTPASATESVSGIARFATQAEATAGTVDTATVTPLKMKTAGDLAYQPKNANLTALSGYTVSTATALGTSDTVLPTQAAVKAYADGLIGANDAMVFKGVINASTNPNYPAADAGHTYRVSTPGKIGGASGVNVEAGDLLVCIVDGTAAGTQATVGSNWSIVQTNLDGAVTSNAASSTSQDIAVFMGTSGKLIGDSGLQASTDGTMAANSTTKLPTESAVRTYVSTTNYTKTELGNPETDLVALYTTAKA